MELALGFPLKKRKIIHPVKKNPTRCLEELKKQLFLQSEKIKIIIKKNKSR